MPDPTDEFGLIARHLAPLAGEGALGLADDVGMLNGLAVTHDIVVEHTHFLPDDPLEDVGWKAVAVNASDLIAKGCAPVAMLVGTVWPSGADEAAFAALAAGIGEAGTAYGAALLGGDTTRQAGAGPLCVGITMIGRPRGEGIVSRGGASIGDALFVGGTVGDAHVGLAVRRGVLTLPYAWAEAAASYRRPAPPLPAAELIAKHAAASIDLSDGLLADAGHVARGSGLRCRIVDEAVPVSRVGEAYLDAGGEREHLWAGGDDYVPLVAVPPARAGDFAREAAAAGVPFARIGACEAGEGVVLERGGVDRTPASSGYVHF